jgi:hypothetical protein
VLLTLTLVVVAVVVLLLVAVLVSVIWMLVDARRSLQGIADGLERVCEHTRPLEEKLVTINGALSALGEALGAADGHLGRAARVFRL